MIMQKKQERLKQATVLIIRRGNEYLIARIFGSRDLRWGISPYDAWSTRRPADAKKVQAKTGGEIMLFNPVTGTMREARV